MPSAALPTSPSALYGRVVKGQKEALDALLASPGITWQTPVGHQVYSVLHGICACQDAARQMVLLQRFAEAYPAGHAVWQKQRSHGLMGGMQAVQFFTAHGATWTDATDGLATLVDGFPEVTQAQPLIAFLRDQWSASTHDQALHQGWNQAVLSLNFSWMAWALEQGVNPKERLRNGSNNGWVPLHFFIYTWNNHSNEDIHEGLHLLWRHGARFSDPYPNAKTAWQLMEGRTFHDQGSSRDQTGQIIAWESAWSEAALQAEVDALPSTPRARRPRL